MAPSTADEHYSSGQTSDEPVTGGATSHKQSGSSEKDREPSSPRIVEKLLRELLNVERGFWDTLKALSTTPGAALQAYLNGDRKRLVNPGSYLLTALAISYSVKQGLTWIGVRVPPRESSLVKSALASEGTPAAIQEYITSLTPLLESEEADIVLALLIVVPLGLLLWRLFQNRFSKERDAYAFAAFLVGHITLLEVPIFLIHLPSARLITGDPVSELSPIYVGIFIGYVGWASYDCFGRGWKSAAKGLLSAAWAGVEIGAISGLLMVGYVAWLVYPAMSASSSRFILFLLAALTTILAAPLLLHAAVEAYYRLR